MHEPTHCGFHVLSGNEDAHDAIGVICGRRYGLHFSQTSISQHFKSVKCGAERREVETLQERSQENFRQIKP